MLEVSEAREGRRMEGRKEKIESLIHKYFIKMAIKAAYMLYKVCLL